MYDSAFCAVLVKTCKFIFSGGFSAQKIAKNHINITLGFIADKPCLNFAELKTSHLNLLKYCRSLTL